MTRGERLGGASGLASLALALLFAGASLSAGEAARDATRSLPKGKQPDDQRLGPLRTLNDYFPFHQVKSADEWSERAERLRRRVKVATGLWPLWPKNSLNPVVHQPLQRDGYTVSKVILEALPGFYVTGSLYVPEGEGSSRPGILCPHGHWNDGRFYDHGADRVASEIEQGAEVYEVGGRYPIQARCVQLARMGCVVFAYDMIGYADSVQLAHRPGFRPEMNTPEDWGFFSPQAELRLQNMMGLQTWTSIRALDFLLSRPDVDPERIGVTGASGGGTQTFMLMAVDDRPDAAFPAVMVSTAMQGGCTCENAPYLRIEAGNIDLAALAAPRPLGMSGADDWTKEILTKGYPDLRQLYAMLGHPDRVHAEAFTQFGHNYNSVSRHVMYRFFAEHLDIDVEGDLRERDFEPVGRDEGTVWQGNQPRPQGDQTGDAFERRLLAYLTEVIESQYAEALPQSEGDTKRFRTMVGGGWDVLLGRRLPDLGDIGYELVDKTDLGDSLRMTALLTNAQRGEQVPTLYFYPKSVEWNGKVVVWLHEEGKAGLATDEGGPTSAVAELLDAGFAVAGLDLLYQGEFVGDEDAPTGQRTQPYGNGNAAWQQYAGYTFGYNHPLFSQRVHDVLTMLRHIATDPHGAEEVFLVGLGPTVGPVAAGALAQAPGTVAGAAIDTRGFRFASLDRLDHPMFVPGAVKYGDVPGLVALASPTPLWLAGESRDADVVTKVYGAEGAADAVLRAVEKEPSAQAAARWVLQRAR